MTKTGWGVSIPSIDRYIARAETLLARTARPREDYILAVAKYRLDELYARALLAQNFSEAREAVRDLCRLYGLPIDGAAGSGGTEDEQDRPIAILVGPERLLTHEEWNAKHGTSRIPALEPTSLLRTTEKPKAEG